MQPVEINAGGYYLRTLRADDLVDDRPALLTAFADPSTARWIPEYQVRTRQEATEYIALREQEWLANERCSWAVADVATGDMLGEVGLKNLSLERREAAIACWTHPAHRGRGIAAAAVSVALRFGFEALELWRIEYWYADGNLASAKVAAKCGFATLLGKLPGAAEVDGEQRDLLCFARHADDLQPA